MSGAIFKSTSVVGLTTLLSRVTGLLRDMVYSQAFGAGTLMDAFLVAFKIPNFLRRLFAEGAFSQSFVPVISEYKVRREHAEVRELVGGVVGTLGAVLFVVTLVGVLAAPIIILLFAPGFTQEAGKYELAVDMLRWTFPYLFFISLTALFSGVLNSYGRFAVPAFTQVVMNLVMILFAIGIATHSDSPGIVLAIGVFVAGVAQVLIQLPSVAKLGLLSRPRWQPAAEGVQRIGKLMIPGIIGSSMAQVSLLLDTLIASFLVTGSIAWLYYADRLMEFALGVFSIALATVILPRLSSQHSAGDTERFSATLDWSLRLVIVVVVPAAVGLLVLAGPITATIFGYGEFSARDVQMTQYGLMAYSWGLIGFSLVKVLAPGYFARQDTKTPVRVGLIALAVNMGLNVGVVLPAHYAGFATPFVLLATSTCISAAVNSFMLWRGLLRDGVYRPAAGWQTLLLRVLAANGAMALVLLWLAPTLESWIAAAPAVRALRLAGCIGAGALVYAAVLAVLGLRPAHLRNSSPRGESR
ncbi:MAG: murein biosynthesis integral membrane protein MurJ [Gammaproteobacteria bacterium]|jgi:putative peptidoglycan lipid II flippase|nr:murein biosynthesis integral membrane protein MurJ [Gammaproteobacteria bacterium]NDA43960.1 murein biosynthesis integral membrane protein MurJ [Gammaproteobacteria bacterium]NDB25227.1 murein biosynthesis integral membrane protein MurJ [Gammaproteobacteria bacterium]NDF85204.1 murein biosynthesis integral membrane protein MurJ [Gammaproteobacteria bacterium]